MWQIVELYANPATPVHYIYRKSDPVMQEHFERLVLQCESLWYVRARPWVDDADGKILNEIDARYVRGETLEFPGVSAIHFTAQP